MASGQEILPHDLPPELTTSMADVEHASQQHEWTTLLSNWAEKQLVAGRSDILGAAQIDFERILLNCALKHTHGHKQEAAKRLGWGRNTLTRKLKELNMDG
jgi:two-component system nitrogen regulation response regulator GlnG